MAEFFLDVSVIGNGYQAYADTPTTWGVPQDGNGKAGPGHLAAVAIATIDCNGAVGSANGTVSVLGVTVSSTLTTSGAALATDIVTAINASAVATGATISAALLPLNRLVFARVNPVLTTEVQIMLRIAGTDWNGMLPTRANITGGGVTAFAGGVNGPFSYLISSSPLFGKAARGYGVSSVLKVGSVTDPGLIDDVIHVRTRRAGVDLTVTMTDTATSAYTWTTAPAGTYRTFFCDNGTLWAGDAGVLTVQLTATNGFLGGGSSVSATGPWSVSSKSGKRFRMLFDARAGVLGYTIGGNNITLDGILIEESAVSTTGVQLAAFANSQQRFSLRNSTWIAKGGRQLGATSGNPGSKAIFENVEFEYFGLSANVTSLINLNSGGANDQNFRFTACSFKDRNGVYSISNPIIGSSGAPSLVEFDNCTGMGAVAAGWPAALSDGNRLMLWENFGPSRDWRVESGTWLSEWRVGQNFPTLTSTLPSGLPWSAKVFLRNVGFWGITHKPLKLPGIYREATAVRTITLEMLTNTPISRSILGLLFAYIDVNDVVRYQTTLLSHAQHLVAPINCDTSTKVWTLNGTTGQAAYKLSLVTDFPIKQNTEFVAWLVFNGVLLADQSIYVNAEVDIT